MKIKKIEWRNFGSYGNKIQKLEFDENEGHFYLVMGSNGAGKCVDKHTEIDLFFGDKEKEKEYKELTGSPQTGIFVKTTLERLHFYVYKHKKSLDEIYVKTRHGVNRVFAVDITAKNSEVYKIETNSGRSLKASPSHLLKDVSGKWKKVSEFKKGDVLLTDAGEETVKYVKKLDYKDDLYDIQVALVHEYFANGFVSHNSTISDVITFSLYGRLSNKKLSDIPNRFNGSAWCRITLKKNEFTEVVIERGISPGILKCYINGKEYDRAAKKNIQTFIEEEIIGLPFYVFNNTISLSVNDFKSLIAMRPSDKRMIIDKIFGLQIINKIYEFVKQQIKDIRYTIKSLDSQIDVFEHSIKNAEIELQKLQEQIKHTKNSKIENIKESLKKYKETVEILNQKYSNAKQKQEELSEKINKILEFINNEKYVIKQAQEKEKLYQNEKCPVCESDLTDNEHQEILKNWLERKIKSEKNIELFNKNLQKYKELKEKINGIIKKYETQKQKALITINHLEKELKQLTLNETNAQTASLQNIINESLEKLQEVTKTKKANEKKENFYKILEDIFGEKGVKQWAIKRILPTLNTEINRIVRDLGMEYKIMFNEEFDAHITHMGHEVKPQMLSTGERKKIDFAILITLIRIMKIKYNGLNLIFLDEIFSSLDSNGIYHILKILSEITKELKLNTFVINHSQLPVELFDYQLKIEKTNGFSSISIEKIE